MTEQMQSEQAQSLKNGIAAVEKKAPDALSVRRTINNEKERLARLRKKGYSVRMIATMLQDEGFAEDLPTKTLCEYISRATSKKRRKTTDA